ncbi:MAG: hypothetical protein ACQETQ_06530 [Spirochaetota bacterium]
MQGPDLKNKTMKTLSQIPSPHNRFFPHHADRPRRVYVTISFFHGTGSHFHVEMQEEHNYVFDPETEEWLEPDNDPRGEGRHRFMKFSREETARRWVEDVFSQEFSNRTHELVFRGDVTQRWFYREGD